MHVQAAMPLPRPSSRRAGPPQPYRLPPAVKDRLTSALERFRNRDAALALATFLGRFWSMPGRVALPFPVDRRALADRPDLGLSEARIRGALKTLEAIGYLVTVPVLGSRYKATAEGLRRKPVPWQFGREYAAMLIAANNRAGVARDRHLAVRRAQTPDSRQRACTGSAAGLTFRAPNSPKDKTKSELSLGEKRIGLPPKAFVPDANLAAALERLRSGVFGMAGRKREGRG